MIRNKKENYLDKIPVKNEKIQWSESDGIITIHLVHKGIYSKIAQKFFHTPQKSDIALDKFGSFVWKQIDGVRSILEIGKIVKNEFGKEAEPLYERLSKYIYILTQEKYIKLKRKESIK